MTYEAPAADDARADEEASYRSYVFEQAASDAEPGTAFLNKSTAHAAIVVEALFRQAQRSVRILTNALSDDVYGTPLVIEAAVAFLRREGARLEIIAESRPCRVMLDRIGQVGLADRVDIRLLPPHVTKIVDVNYMLVDERSYRFETEKGLREATVQFNGEAVASRILDNFQMLQPHGAPLELVN